MPGGSRITLTREVTPALDIWLTVSDNEFHYVQKILPTLDWRGGQLGVRLALEPKDATALQQEYVTVRAANKAVQAEALMPVSVAAGAVPPVATASAGTGVRLWPECLTDFMAKRLSKLFVIKAYTLDPAKCVVPQVGIAKPQLLVADAEPLEGNPLAGLIRVNEIDAQRGFGHADDESGEGDDGSSSNRGRTGRLSEQLKRYYNAHLDPFELPDPKDLRALQAIEVAQKAFDGRLKEGFSDAIKEMETLGYPGVTDPHIEIATRIHPIDGLNHLSAVQYVVAPPTGASSRALTLPEHYNGLGYQNLISMVFRLMSFRDGWMKVKKAASKAAKATAADAAADATIAPLHLVLVEEPEAHLHAQVQQVFIREAYKILRNNPALGSKRCSATLRVVSAS
jgi:predicted ATP-dependent endonuclease of OLD family